MTNALTQRTLVILVAVLAWGCKKGDAATGAAGSSTTTAAATGITGKINGKPFTGKVALLQLDSEGGNPTVYITAWDAKCTGNPSGPLGIPPKGINQATVTAPLKTGVQPFARDKVEGGVSFWGDKGQLSSSISNPTGEIEWLAVPTDKTKGLLRVKFALEGNDAKLDGSMDVTQCPK